MKKKSAIILGATGLTGQYVLQYLIDNPAYEQVTVISRRPLELDHPKVHVLVCDLFKLENIKDQFKADEVFVALVQPKRRRRIKKHINVLITEFLWRQLLCVKQMG